MILIGKNGEEFWYENDKIYCLPDKNIIEPDFECRESYYNLEDEDIYTNEFLYQITQYSTEYNSLIEVVKDVISEYENRDYVKMNEFEKWDGKI